MMENGMISIGMQAEWDKGKDYKLAICVEWMVGNLRELFGQGYVLFKDIEKKKRK